MRTVQLLTPTEASEIYGIPESELLLLAKSGKIAYYYFGRKMIRFSHNHILKYIDPSYLTEEEEEQLAKEQEKKSIQKRQIQMQEEIESKIESKRRQKEREYEEYCSLSRAYSEAIYLFNFLKEGNSKEQLQALRLQALLDQIRSLERSKYKIDKIEQKKLIDDFNIRIAAIFITRKKYKKILIDYPLYQSRFGFNLGPYITRARSRCYSENRRVKFLESDEEITTIDWINICEQWGNKCLCCGKSGDYRTLTMDHVKPLKYGGQHKKNNIQPLCKNCNSKKGAKYVDYRR